ncbi:MAG TPA: dCMP deaminase family protein, partial [Candidatus Micrarchaeota archaeon]|nr:dCMP deaminase family protein [Candidatus Micrarchaeota archaeon]
SSDKNRQQLAQVFKMSTKKITNDADIILLHDNVDKMLGEISAEFKSDRPSWDDYFMGIAKMVATRSNCIKRHVAAVIVKDKRIVSTGYNGTPRGTRNCDQGGCPRCNSFADSGTKLDECFCSHAEENAICQAAYHGISIKDSSIYITYSPCLTCTRMIINSGIKEVIYNENYPLGQSSIKLLQEAGVKARQMKLKE